MKSFNKLSGIVTFFTQVNIDTDAIIPKQFLKQRELVCNIYFLKKI